MFCQGYRFVEHYAGAGEMTRAAAKKFGHSTRLDKLYHRAMDVLSPAGFATFDSTVERIVGR